MGITRANRIVSFGKKIIRSEKYSEIGVSIGGRHVGVIFLSKGVEGWADCFGWRPESGQGEGLEPVEAKCFPLRNYETEECGLKDAKRYVETGLHS